MRIICVWPIAFIIAKAGHKNAQNTHTHTHTHTHTVRVKHTLYVHVLLGDL